MAMHDPHTTVLVLTDEEQRRWRDACERLNLSPEAFIRLCVEEKIAAMRRAFETVKAAVLADYTERYRRLA
jgi:hypothetical protein